jgi:signal transduction histidine kinase
MRERATELGGTLEIDSQTKVGTTVRAIVPASESTPHR